MITHLERFIRDHRREAYTLFRRCLALGRPLLQRPDILREFHAFCQENERHGQACDEDIRALINATQEAAAAPPDLYLALRAGVAHWQYVHVQVDAGQCRPVPVQEYLKFKERLVDPAAAADPWALEVDLSPFERGFPKLGSTRSIGRGVEYLNRHLSHLLFQDGSGGRKKLFSFLKIHNHRGRQLMLNDLVHSLDELRATVRNALEVLESRDPETTWDELAVDLVPLGLEPGWGRTAAMITESLSLLGDILEAPSPENLERFLGRIPMIFSLVILSPHGYFGQSGVLGKPDTGGQVVYILDQVRALEKELIRSIRDQGLDIEPRLLILTRLLPEAEGTTCDQPREAVVGTRYTHILRIPFRGRGGEIIRRWIPRFRVWPYLEQFAADAEQVVLAELGGRPDLVIGNYSDGNLVASLLARKLGVTQCNIAHALEKSKYHNSAIFWQDYEREYHFSAQFTADLIAMNTADFIITSTYQEIAGTPEVIGQYESYTSFTMPGLYRVLQGIDPFDPKFNIVSPGADPEVFFPFDQQEQRIQALLPEIEELVKGPALPDTRGALAEPDKPLLFAMSRLDSIKNVTGLLELYGRSDALREEANLLVAAGYLDPDRSQDEDEKRQIARMHDLFDRYDLERQVRWIPMRTDKTQVGELYRYIADCRGAFVQPAIFEAFGLTVVEAMSSGLPTFATCHGGPLEIIEDGVSGFHIDPLEPETAAAKIADFFARCRTEPELWERISEGARRRIEMRYTWSLYANRLLTLSRIYGFWKFITNIERAETRRYLEMFYTLVFRDLAERVPRDPQEDRPREGDSP